MELNLSNYTTIYGIVILKSFHIQKSLVQLRHNYNGAQWCHTPFLSLVLLFFCLALLQLILSLPLPNPTKCNIWDMQVIPLVKFGSREASEYHINIHLWAYYHIQYISSNQKANPNQQKPLKSNSAQGKSKGEWGQYLRGMGRNVSPHFPPPKTTDLGGSGGGLPAR